MRNGPEVSGKKVCFTPLVKNKGLRRYLLRWRKYRMSRKRKKLQTPAKAMWPVTETRTVMNAGRILLRICLCIYKHTLSKYLCLLFSIYASCIIMVIKVVSVITCYKSTVSKLWDTKRLGRHSFRDLFYLLSGEQYTTGFKWTVPLQQTELWLVNCFHLEIQHDVRRYDWVSGWKNLWQLFLVVNWSGVNWEVSYWAHLKRISLIRLYKTTHPKSK